MSFEFHKHPEWGDGSHAIFPASKSSWLRYDDNKVISSYENYRAAQRGTEDHNFAKLCIQRGDKLQKCKKTLNLHVNDAIGFGLTPELPLVPPGMEAGYFGERLFAGTTDAIGFEKGTLRIHDLKTGVSPTHMEQLYVYVALFCLEYKIDPRDIKVETRIYQNGEVEISVPTVDEIQGIMEHMIHVRGLIEKYNNDR